MRLIESHRIIIHPDGKREKDKILERQTAMIEVEKFPDTFDFVEVDVKELITNDIKRSIDGQSSLKTPIRRRYKLKNKHINTAIGIIGILIGLYIAYVQGVFDSILGIHND